MTDPGEGTTDLTTDSEGDAPPPELGDPGKKALDAMKAKLKAANARAAEATAERDRLTAAAEAIDATAIEKRIRAQVAGERATERAVDRIEVHAATMSVDPDVARAMLAAKVGDFIEDGKVSDQAIKDALAALVEEKPYLAARAGKRFNGSADNGARAASAPPADMNALLRQKAGY